MALTTDTSGPLAERLERRELDLVLGLPGPSASYRVLDLCTFGMFWIAHGAMEVSEQALGKDDLLSHPIISYEIGMYNHGRLVEYLSESGFERSLVHYSIPGHHGLHDHGGDRHRGVAPSSSRTNCATARCAC